MPSLKIIHKIRGKNKVEGVLYLQIINSRTDKTEVSLRVKLDKSDWDSLRQKIKSKNRQSSKLNIYLANEKNAYESLINDKLAKGIQFTVKDVVKERKSQKNNGTKKGDFVEFFEKYLETNSENLRYNTLKSYLTCLNKIKLYSPKLSFSKFNEEWFVGFEKEQIRQGQRINTIQDKVKVLKKITAICLREGKISASPFENYKGKTEPGTREFLNKSEFLSLCNLDGLSKGHEIVRDVFVFGCFTGLRFSDMCTLSSDQINTETDADGKMDYRISIRMQKTKGLLTLKLAKGAIRIIREYGYPNEESVLPILKFPSSKYLTETALKEAISSRNAYFNKVIKQLCAKADIKKHISMHCSRHTFATLSLDLDIPIQVVSKMLGHKNLKATMIYAKIMDKQKDAAIDAWDNL